MKYFVTNDNACVCVKFSKVELCINTVLLTGGVDPMQNVHIHYCTKLTGHGLSIHRILKSRYW